MKTRPIIALSVAVMCLGCESTPKNQSDNKPNATHHINARVDQKPSLPMKTRLIETYKELWPLISVDQQHNKLPTLLNDPLHELRSFGIERISVLNRDGEATEEELQTVVSLLADDNQRVRLSAAKLLPEINLSNLAQSVATYLANEKDENVASLEIIYFRDNPNPVAIEPILARINTNLAAESADTFVSLLGVTPRSSENYSIWIKIIRDAKRFHYVPTLLTLEAILGTDKDRRLLIPMLKDNIDSTRLSVAKGFAAVGYWEPLLERIEDPSLMPFTVTALQNKGDLEAFKTLLALRSELKVADWDTAALRILKSLDTRSLLLADDLLRDVGETDLRLSILMKVWKQSENRSRDAHIAIAERTVPLLNSTAIAAEALLLLEEYRDAIFDEKYLSLLFKTAILASSWDSAADARSDPQPWVNAWQTMKIQDPAAAVVIRQQIIQRFKDILTESQRQTLELEEASVVTEETTEQEVIP